MKKILAKKSLNDICKDIASHNPPVPAGGTTIAINGLLGISLLELTYTVSKKTWSRNLKENFNIQNQLQELKYMYLKAMDEDTLAFKKSMEAKEISKNIIEIPLKIILSSKTIHNIAVQLEPHIKKAVIADYQIARENLLTAINGGINIIESNYSFFGKNPNYINKTRNVLSNIKHYLKSIDTDFQKI